MKENGNPTLKAAIWVWGIANLYFILSVTVAILSGILLPSVQKQLDLSSTQLGLLGFAFFLSFGLVQFLIGSLIDTKGPKGILTASALIAAAGLYLLSRAETFSQAACAQILTGMGFSISYVGAIYLAQTWFSERQFPLMSGITQMSANIVSALALFCMAVAGIIFIDFRTIAAVLGSIALALSILIVVFVKRSPTDRLKIEQKTQTRSSALAQLFRIPQFWYGVLYFGTNFGVFLTFSSLWNIPDSLAYGHSLKIATQMSATLRFGGAFGAVLSGLLMKSLRRCSLLVKFYSTGCLCLAAILIYGPVFPSPLTFFIMALLGFFAGGTALGFPLLVHRIPPSLKGAGFGFMTSFGYLLCAFLESLVGMLLSHAQSMNQLSSVSAFKIALTPLVAVLVIGWFCSLKLQDKSPS